MKIHCKQCMTFEQDNQLFDSIMNYIESLDKEIKVSQDLYNKRLAICEKCNRLKNGMCGFCGCFVAVRAVKQIMGCPHPTEKKW